MYLISTLGTRLVPLLQSVIIMSAGCTGEVSTIYANILETVILPCDHRLTTDEIHTAQWFRGQIDDNPPIAQNFRGTKTVSQKYGLTDDFSLALHNVSVLDEGMYTCYISPNGLKQDYYGHASLNVTAFPTESNPVIKGCGHLDANETCKLEGILANNTYLSCEVSGVYPELYPSWGFKNETRQMVKNTDGTYRTSASVAVSDTQNAMILTCTYTYGSYRRSSHVQLFFSNRNVSPQDPTTPTRGSTMIIAVTVSILIAFLLVVFVLKIKVYCRQRRALSKDVERASSTQESKSEHVDPTNNISERQDLSDGKGDDASEDEHDDHSNDTNERQELLSDGEDDEGKPFPEPRPSPGESDEDWEHVENEDVVPKDEAPTIPIPSTGLMTTAQQVVGNFVNDYVYSIYPSDK